MNPSKEGIDFIIECETGGKSYYEQVYKNTFCWPGESSGPTAMVGIDCAYYSPKELREIFGPYTSQQELDLILGAVGKTGSAGASYTKKLKGITFTWDEAMEVFKKYTVPKFSALTEKAFPGVYELCPDAQAAVLSIVFNRGVKMSGDRRLEMRSLRDAVAAKSYKGMASSIRGMKRLWPDTPSLRRRREQEALLVEKCA